MSREGSTGPERGPALRAGLHLVAFVSATFGLLLALGFLVAGIALATGTDPAHPEALGGGALGALSTLQIAGLAGISAGLARALPLPDGGGTAAERLGAAFPLRAGAGWFLAAAAGSATVWTLPTFLAERLAEWLGQGALALVAEGLADPDPVGRAALVFAIAVAAPICEELAFRGHVWRVLASGAGPAAAFAGSTALFVLYHGDPVQTLALVPTAAFFGWLRLRSGSVAPGILAHFVNNAIALVASFTWPEGAEVPLGPGLAGAAATLGVVAVAEALRARTQGRTS